jgi:hypothetical protein
MEDKEILRRILQGFKLIPAKFPLTYTTIAGKATPDFAKRINAWIETNFPNSLIRVAFDTTHGILKFYRRMQEQLVMEYILRRIIQESDQFATLQITSFRDRPTRVNTFLSKLGQTGADSEFLLKNGNKVSFTDAEIIKKNPVVDPETNEKKPKKEFIFSKDSAEFSKQLPLLEPGDKLSLTGSDRKPYKISDVAKTIELGGQGKGIEQPGKKSENRQISTINAGLKEGPVNIKVIASDGRVLILDKIKQAVPVSGQQKADIALVSDTGSSTYIQLKQPQHRQLEGVVRSNFAKDEEGKKLIIKFARRVKAELKKGRLKEPVIQPINDKRLQRLAVYGTDGEEVPQSSKAVSMYFVGDVQLGDLDASTNTKTLTAAPGGTIYLYPYIAQDNPPVLAAIDKGGRFQKMPSNKKTNIRLADVRLGVYFKNSVPNH